MFELKTQSLIACLNGSKQNLNLCSNTITKIATNDKNVTKNSVFVALKGKNFDGHNFAKKAIAGGAEFAIVEEKIENIPQIVVKNTRQALLNIAALNRQQFKGPVIMITGSAGKTTTKDLIALALSSSENVLKTEQNLNNEIGLAQTLLNLNKTHTAAVIEAGMSHAGEISQMSMATKPTIGIITNIGRAHFQNFKNLNEITNAKLELLNGMDKNSPIIFNLDNEQLKNVNFKNRTTLTCSLKNSNANFFATNIQQFDHELTFQVKIKPENKLIEVKIPLIGEHNVLNTLFSVAVLYVLNIELEPALKKLETFQSTGLRQKILTKNNIKIFIDCYNAIPESMEQSLKCFSQAKCDEKKIAVLGDMLELGTIAKTEHEKIGTMLNNLQIDEIVCFGPLAKNILLKTNKPAHHFKNELELTEFLKSKLEPGNFLLFKARHAVHLENIIKKIFKNTIKKQII